MQDNFKRIIDKNFERLSSSPYDIGSLFKPSSYDWPGDYEGRALLAFCSHYAISKRKVPQFDLFFEEIPSHLNAEGYFGPLLDENDINEQQLSGNSWFLRGLLSYNSLFHDDVSMSMAHEVIKNLYLRALPHYALYPTNRVNGQTEGKVYGSISNRQNGWDLSTDIGCAFISLDGLSTYYLTDKDPNLGLYLKKAISSFLKIDYGGLKMQTHAFLSGVRGIFKFYLATKESQYLQTTKKLFDFYLSKGLTFDYENFNWFNNKNSWTEPCCVVDSLLLSISLYKATGEERYKKIARRILFGGFAFSIRPNGGAGTNSCVSENNPILSLSMDEAYQCCTMRLSEGLRYCYENIALFDSHDEGRITKEGNRYFYGDAILGEDLASLFVDRPHYNIDGHDLIRIPTLLDLSWEEAREAKIKILF